jgi:hypothetical protein
MSTAKKNDTMKKMFWTVGGFCAAAAGFLVFGPKLAQPVDLLTDRFEEDRTEEDTLVETD